MDALAIHGGSAVRSRPIRPVVNLSPEAIGKVVEILRDGELSRWYGGEAVLSFEDDFAKYHGVTGGVAVNSGTSALHAAYVACGLREGDEVIVPASCYISAVSAFVQEGAVPVVCDIDPETLNLDPSKVAEKVSERTRLIVPVHLYGYPTDMDPILEIAKANGILVVEDCGQSHGATYKGRPLGSLGDMACFSFAPRKHISTGQGGMVIGRDPALLNEVRKLANKGKGDGWLAYERLGFSYAMPEIEAVIGLEGLSQLGPEVARREAVVKAYQTTLQGTPLEFPPHCDFGRSSHFKLPLKLPTEWSDCRDFFVEALNAENVSARQPHPPVDSIDWVHELCDKSASRAGAAGGSMNDMAAARSHCPTAVETLARIVEVETGPGLSVEDAAISAQGVLKVWRYVENSARA